MIKNFRAALIAALVTVTAPSLAWAEPLSSWRDTGAKERITSFVEMVTDEQSGDFVPEAKRIAVFDNDGTLWAEKPLYFQLFFALDRLKEMAATDPSILTSDVLKAAAAGDLEAVGKAGTEGLLEIVSVTHSGMSVDEFIAEARNWLDTARHAKTGMAYDDMIYQPMVELLEYLRANGFKTYIVSGGGVDFIRSFAEEAYGIPPEQVIGTRGNSTYEVVDGQPMVVKQGGIDFLDDKAGKPVAIQTIIGQRPLIAGGNSDGDFEMLEWSTAGEGPRLGILVHHTDAEREWAYDRESHVGKLVRGLDEGPDRGWLIIDMKADWERVWP